MHTAPAAYCKSPAGWIKIQASAGAITSVAFCSAPAPAGHHRTAVLDECIRQLDEYFAGARQTFHLPVRQAGTAFQQSVWNALADIPFGRTVSYANLAQMLNRPKAARAVGAACARNRLWIIVPCHRVIGAAGALTGYAGGTERKKWLLEHEAQVLRRSERAS